MDLTTLLVNPPKQALPEGKEVCNICDTVISSELADRHAETHAPKPEFKTCEHCGKRYKRSHRCKKAPADLSKKEAALEVEGQQAATASQMSLDFSALTLSSPPVAQMEENIQEAASIMATQGSERGSKDLCRNCIGTLYVDCLPQDKVAYVWDGSDFEDYKEDVVVLSSRVDKALIDFAAECAQKVVVSI